MSKTVEISVRHLVEFVLREGDIDTVYISATAMSEGTRLHNAIQKDRAKYAKEHDLVYEKEYSLRHSFECGGFVFTIHGRADGVMKGGELTVLDEIKSTTYMPEYSNPETRPLHWAQAVCYAFMLCGQEEASVCVNLIYIHQRTEEKRSFERQYTYQELKEIVLDIAKRYIVFAEIDSERREVAEQTAQNLSFPYSEYRTGQRELCVSVYTAIKQKRWLFAQAPTGTGKTISAFFPAVKAVGQRIGDKIFYMTAKTVTRRIAEEAMALMTRNGLNMRTITLTAKDRICFLEKRACNPEDCTYASGHFDRVNACIADAVKNETLLTADIITTYAQKHMVCPFELQLDISLFCDVIICDYNHVFDPKARLKRFFSNAGDGADYILLCDEAHNLVDRARDMFSATLQKSDMWALRSAFEKKHPIFKLLGKINKVFIEMGKDNEIDPSDDAIQKITEKAKPLKMLLEDFCTLTNEWLVENQHNACAEIVMEMYFAAVDFLRIYELLDEHYTVFVSKTSQDVSVKLFCVDPSKLLAETRERSRTLIYFSATLTPLTYFRQILGGCESDFLLRLMSPFPRENLCLVIDTSVSTRYRDRASSFDQIASRLNVLVNAKPGNYLAFFPSYEYLNAVRTRFEESFPQIRTITQTTSMTEEDKENFLGHFEDMAAQREQGVLGFAVMGGMFSEGIDLTGEKLIGVAVIGVGLPQINPERDIISKRSGFEIAYMYPGMNKVMQAAGRVLRTETDRGVILLIDNRFTHTEYKRLFPPEWAGFHTVRNEEALDRVAKVFWNGTNL